MIDKSINGADWVECPAGAYSIRSDQNKTSRCTIEADIDFDQLITHECTGLWQRIAPLRVLSFDIGKKSCIAYLAAHSIRILFRMYGS